MGLWSERVVPRVNDKSLSARPVMELRNEVCRGLSGRVLEIGFGTGLNIGAYPPEGHLRRRRGAIGPGVALSAEQSYLPGPGISKPWGFCSLVTASKP